MNNSTLKILIAICTAWFFIFYFNRTEAQNAPVTTVATIGNSIPGQNDTIPVTVTGFSGIGSVSLSLDYDYSKLHYVSSIINPLLGGSYNVGDNNLGTGTHRLVTGWYGGGASLTDGSWIVKYVFTYIYGTATLQWYDDGPSCSYANTIGDVLNDSPTSTYYINGLVCGALPNPGTITGNPAICYGTTAGTYSINPIAGTLGYSWTLPQGVSIAGNPNSNSINVNFSSSAASGNITVNGMNQCGNGSLSSLTVNIYPMLLAQAQNDTTIMAGTSITLHTQNGGSGTYNYHWSPENLLVNPDIQNPQTIAMNATTIFTVLVTTQGTSCQSSDQVLITVDTLTSVNKSASPEKTFRIYPNPATNHFTIDLPESITQPITLKFLAPDGILVKEINLINNSGINKLQIDANDFAKGIYFINISTGDQNMIQKLIIY